MSWFVFCDGVRVSHANSGNVEYEAEVRKHTCPSELADRDMIEALNSAPTNVNIFPFQSGWRGYLKGQKAEIHGPILSDPDTPKAVVSYIDSGGPHGSLVFDIILPHDHFLITSRHLDQLLYSPASVQMLIIVGFDGFVDAPVNWAQFQRPTREQFFSPFHNQGFRPYVTNEVNFKFARSFGA